MPALPDLFSPVTKLIIPCCMLRHRLGADQLKAWCVGCLHSDQRRIYMLFEPVVCATIHRCSQPLVNVRNTHSLGSTNRSHLRFLRHRPERSERCMNYEKLPPNLSPACPITLHRVVRRKRKTHQCPRRLRFGTMLSAEFFRLVGL